MDDNSPNMSNVSMKGLPACRRCYMLVARYAPQVVAPSGTYHRECYEAWHLACFGTRPRLAAGLDGERHRYGVRDAQGRREPRAA